MKRTLMFRAAASALLFSLACSPGDVAQEAAPPPPEPAPGPELPTAPPSDNGPDSPGAPCGVDADCDAGNFCALRICIAGCPDAALCDADEACDPHGRCIAPGVGEGADPSLTGIPGLADRLTVLAFGQTQARTMLRNDGTAPLAYRLAAANTALTLDMEPVKLAPGEEVDLVVDVESEARSQAVRASIATESPFTVRPAQ